MDRRLFIKHSTMGAGVVANLKIGKMNVSAYNPSMANSENDNILVIIQMFGGNDGINTITPYDWDSYYTLYRPNLNVPKASVFPISVEKGMAMHPNLKLGVKDGMLGLFNAGKLSIISGVGYDNPNYSHFRSTDIWLSGIVPPNDGQALNTGWFGRYFDKYNADPSPESPYCLQVGKTPSLMFLGQEGSKSFILENADDMYNQAQSVESNKIAIGGAAYFTDEFNYLNSVGIEVNNYSKVIKKAFDAGKNIETYENNDLSNQLKLVARLINGGLKSKVYFVEMYGFDTHANQGTLDGAQPKLLAQLSQGISSFQSDIEQLGLADKVLGITTSEFGRRPYENGSMGTDHGTSNFMFAFGTKLRAPIIGTHIAFLPFRDMQNLSFSYDFRSIYYEVMVTWFGQTPAFAESVLGSKFAYVDQKGFIKTTVPDATLPPPPVIPTTSADPNSPFSDSKTITEQDTFNIFPNPVVGNSAFLNMRLYFAAIVEITQVSHTGQVLGVIHKKNYRSGIANVYLDLLGGTGLYILNIKVGNRYHYVKFIKM